MNTISNGLKQTTLTAIALFIAVSILSGCRSTLEKQGLLSPDPVISEMFVTKFGGFVINKEKSEVRYTLTLEPRRPITQSLKLDVAFQNPEDKSKPLSITQDVPVDAKSIEIKSPPIRGLKPAHAYEILVRASDANGTLLGSHRQLIQSMIGMRGDQIQIFR